MSAFLFAQRAKTIKNKIKANIKRSNEELERIILKLEEEIKKLKLALDAKNKNPNDDSANNDEEEIVEGMLETPRSIY